MSAEPMQRTSDDDRDSFRRSIRGTLEARWPVVTAVEQSRDPVAVRKIWSDLLELGLDALGASDGIAAVHDILIAFEELGRASCPAPLLGSVMFNFALHMEDSRPRKDRTSVLLLEKPSIAVAFGAVDGDLEAGRMSLDSGRLAGKISFVDDLIAVTHIMVLVDSPATAAIISPDAKGVSVTTTPGLAVPSIGELACVDTDAILLPLTGETLESLAAIARLCSAARALGAAERNLELAVEHAKIRRQFGQFIGQFQALQHKLADCLIRVDGSRLALEAAATAFDGQLPGWKTLADAALAFSGPALRQVALEVHHAVGAIGYAEEHEMPRHFRRIHADVVRMGGLSRARRQLADNYLGPIDVDDQVAPK